MLALTALKKNGGARMFCRKCGTPLPENTAFCKKCGTPQNAHESHPQMQNQQHLANPQQQYPLMQENHQHQYHPYSPVSNPKKAKKGIIAVAAVAVLVLLAVFLIFRFASSDDNQADAGIQANGEAQADVGGAASAEPESTATPTNSAGSGETEHAGLDEPDATESGVDEIPPPAVEDGGEESLQVVEDEVDDELVEVVPDWPYTQEDMVKLAEFYAGIQDNRIFDIPDNVVLSENSMDRVQYFWDILQREYNFWTKEFYTREELLHEEGAEVWFTSDQLLEDIYPVTYGGPHGVVQFIDIGYGLIPLNCWEDEIEEHSEWLWNAYFQPVTYELRNYDFDRFTGTVIVSLGSSTGRHYDIRMNFDPAGVLMSMEWF